MVEDKFVRMYDSSRPLLHIRSLRIQQNDKINVFLEGNLLQTKYIDPRKENPPNGGRRSTRHGKNIQIGWFAEMIGLLHAKCETSVVPASSLFFSRNFHRRNFFSCTS